MKTFIIAVTVSLLFLNKAEGQQYYISKILDNYYRLNPFDYDFSFFFNKLKSDPSLLNKSIKKRTDSSLFSFKGEYENFSQGDHKFAHAEVKLEEIEVEIDSLHTKDTLFQYQITCYCFGGKTGLETAKKAFNSLNYEYRVAFTNEITEDIKENEIVSGAIRNYFSYSLPVSPLTTAWSKLNENESVFVIMVRLKLKQNILDLYKFSDIKQLH